MSKVAVIIPVYNKAGTLARAIASVRAQKHANLECVIVDDGSTDSSRDVALKAIEEDKRFKYVYQENSGVAHARNNGVFNHSTAPYVMCLDADDQIQPGYISGLLPELKDDRRVGIAYTRLLQLRKDGTMILSPWPHKFDVRAMFDSHNQIPTAALTRRNVWERLGGQRQRFAPDGAGAEDGDFWLRAVSRGFNVRYTELENGSWFVYTIYQGHVSGNKDYVEPPYRIWSPWCARKEIMPAPSIYPPRLFSHNVRWYDKPQISVIVPVGDSHLNLIENALDSLDAQTYRSFQVIVVFDVREETWEEARKSGRLKMIASTWPDAWFTSTAANGQRARDITSKLEADIEGISFLDRLPAGKRAGPGRARNIGLSMMDTPLVFFLDADDWLDHTALEKMYKQHLVTGHVIFSDHYGLAPIKKEDLDKVHGKVIAYHEQKGLAYIHQYVSDYRCELAMEQPWMDGRDPYIICNVSSLVPRKDMEPFDENIPSWEDVLSFWKMAWKGVCFSRVPEPLLIYRYHTGVMRDFGMKNAQSLLQYAREESDRIKKMGCGCNNKQPLTQQTEAAKMSDSVATFRLSRGQQLQVSDEELVLVEFNPRQQGDMQRFGMHDFGNGNRIMYGPKRSGEKFLVHEKDLEAEISLANVQGREPEMVPVYSDQKELVQEVLDPVVPTPIETDYEEQLVTVHVNSTEAYEEKVTIFPEPIEGGLGFDISELDLGDLKSPERYIAILKGQGIDTVAELFEYDEQHEDGIASIRGIGDKVRETFLEAAAKIV